MTVAPLRRRSAWMALKDHHKQIEGAVFANCSLKT
jgi:hypothetical protein